MACSCGFVTSTVAIGRSVLQLLQLDLGMQEHASCSKEQRPAKQLAVGLAEMSLKALRTAERYDCQGANEVIKESC